MFENFYVGSGGRTHELYSVGPDWFDFYVEQFVKEEVREVISTLQNLRFPVEFPLHFFLNI
jgi:hypothetical protein